MEEAPASDPGSENKRQEAERCAKDGGADDGCVVAMARIFGRVQGVGYRYWTRNQAAKLSLRGYVRNLTDGSVEAVFIGDPFSVTQMLTYCEDGPPQASVSRVDSSSQPIEMARQFDRFRRAPTRDPGAPV